MKNIKNIKTFNNNYYVSSILLLEDKNILISSGNGTKFWDLNNENVPLKSFDNIYTNCNNGLERIDGDKIIVCNSNINLIIISISNFEIINEINDNYYYSIKSIKNKGIFIVGDYG